jgi:hypothetical protein
MISRRRRNLPSNIYHPTETRPEPTITTPYLPFSTTLTYTQMAATQPNPIPLNRSPLTSL